MSSPNHTFSIKTIGTATGSYLKWGVTFASEEEATAYTFLANSLYAAVTVKLGEVAMAAKAGDDDKSLKLMAALNKSLLPDGVDFPEDGSA
jgi:hypothetical protein